MIWNFPTYMQKISSGFGPRTLNGAESIHNGVDFPVPKGTEIHAPLDGYAYHIFHNETGGEQLIILHHNGWKTGYAHLLKIKVKNNEIIKQGQIIALSGNTGAHSTGAHLHFTLTNKEGIKVDPLLYLGNPI